VRVAPSSKNALHLVSWLLALPLSAPLMQGCWDSDPCDPGQIVKDNLCYDPPPPPPPKVDAGPLPEGSVPPQDTFGKSCSTQTDCAGGNAPVCGAPQLPICTQIDCQSGEANQGVCPSGWQCLTVPPNPSVCLKN
jgi:hypothetical protein